MGDVRAAFALALARLASEVEGLTLSPLYRTAPVDGPRQPDYLNAVAVGRTHLTPRALLARLLEVEKEAGRRRSSSTRNAPRPLDLDLLLYGDRRLAGKGLTVPHLRMTERRFVLQPLADVAPRRVVPGTGKTVARLLREAPPQRVEPSGGLFDSAR